MITLYNTVTVTEEDTEDDIKRKIVTERDCMKILLISGHWDGDRARKLKIGVEATETVVMVQKIKETLEN